MQTRRGYLELRTLSLITVLLVEGLLGLPAARAQSAQGSITGTVKDTSGAVIVGTKVTATNLRTQFTRETVTNETGLYTFFQLDPSEYTIKAEMAGFKTFVNERVPLSARDALRVDIVLQLGEATETINVVAEAPVVRTEDAKIESAVDTKFYVTPPTTTYRGTGFFAWDVMNVLPGFHMTRTGGDQAAGLNVNGARGTQLKLTVQGMNQSGTGNYVVPQTAVQEVKIIQHTGPAEYSTAATMDVTIRQGSPQFHGSVEMELKNTALVSGSYWAPQGSVGIPSYALTYSAGGPVYIPKLYPQKDKTFFFFTMERAYNYGGGGGGTQILRDYPTLDMRQGRFDKLIINGKPVVVVDPLTGQPFPNNTIPTSRINSVAQKLLPLYPNPNRGNPDSPVNNFAFDGSVYAFTPNNRAFRIDHNLTQTQTLNFSWSTGRLGSTSDPCNSAPYTICGLFRVSQPYSFDTPSLGWTWTLSPRLVNELRVGMMRGVTDTSQTSDVLPATGQAFLTELGIQGINPGVDTTAYSRFNIREVAGVGAYDKNRTIRNYYTVIDNLSWQKGTHSIKLGMDLKMFQRDILAVPQSSYGTFEFSGRFTGVGFADFLLGVPDTSSVAYPRPLNAGRYQEFGLYIQDKWQMTPDLSVTYGLRNQLWTIPYDERNLYYNFDPKTGSLVVPDQQALAYVHPAWPKNVPVITAAQAGFPEKLREISYLNLAPRVAFAWRPFGRDKTAVRAGYGVYHDPLTFESLAPFTAGPFTASQSYQNQFDSATGRFLFAFPQGVPGSINSTTAGPGSLSFTAINPKADKVPYTQQFSLTIDHEILKDTRLSVGWLGSKSTQLFYRRNINAPAPSNIPFTLSRRNNPLYNVINYTDNGGNATYHAMQVLLKRRFSGGFQFEGGWTWANSLADVDDSGSDLGPGLLNPFNRALNKARAKDVPKHAFVGHYFWTPPIGRGQRFWSNLHPVLNGIVGGYQFSGSFYFSTGQFLTPVFSGRDVANTGLTSGVPDRVCDGNVSGRKDYLNKSADLSCFPIPAAGSGRFGNSGRGIIVGPGTRNMDLALYKTFPLYRERLSFRFGVIASNVWNWRNSGWFNENITTPTGMQPTYHAWQAGGPRNVSFLGSINF